ncbi:MAG: uncharacterized protein KVP18_000830 [Porospora cf. gigantea A]|uniref:uncharacterized protein n=1 Tax=Porospora cf. gigantea A TaxID=2853593 RepID=UPI00355AAFA8|nr:MAG: hypothetical protein KVP18_000830 [Porospora cf. gigantea A]
MRHKKGGEASISRIFSEDDVYFMENFSGSTHRRSISTARSPPARSPPAHPDVKFEVSPRKVPLSYAQDSDRAVKPERRRLAESPRFPSGQAYTVPPLNLDKCVQVLVITEHGGLPWTRKATVAHRVAETGCGATPPRRRRSRSVSSQ